MDPITIAMGLAQFAPGIAKLFTGSDKAAAVAGHVVSIAQAVTGAPTGEVALMAIQADPGKAMDFQLAMADKQQALEQMYLVDVQDARAMQKAALAQEDVFSKRFVYYFASAWSLFSMLYFLAVTFYPPPSDGVRIADTILGVLIASVIGVMFSYFYGTTRANKTKDDTINKLMK
jgi:type III secretory pathway component EscS